MNVIEAYIKFNSQLIILISGFNGCGKTLFAQSLAKDCNLTFINLSDFLLNDTYNTIVDVDGYKFIDWENPEATNWNSFNEKINLIKANGVVISGFIFPTEMLDFKPDVHINIKISKDDLIKNRKEFLDERNDSKISSYSDESFSDELEKKIINKVSFGHYQTGLEGSIITKSFPFEMGKGQESYNDIFTYLVEFIENDLYGKYKKFL